MSQRDIVVVGASAGGVDALVSLVSTLGPDLPVSVFVVLHVPPGSPSFLPQILSRAGPFQATHPQDGEEIRPGHIYVAPPDHHLLVEERQLVVRRGPKENRVRPSIDALFRSAAYVYGQRAVGVVLSGTQDDGTSGLWSIKRRGGVAIVQQPDEAVFPDMPRNALAQVDVDHVAPASEVGRILARLALEPLGEPTQIPAEELNRLQQEIEIAFHGDAFQMGIMGWGEPAPFTCPECHGILVRLEEGKRSRFRCHTGHAFTASALLAGVTEQVEDTLWQAVRGLEECTMLLQDMGEHFANAGQAETARLFFEKAAESEKRARAVHDSLPHHEHLSQDIQYENDVTRR
jgi:two-component system chemotaxis response regulator CheB